MLSPIIYWAEWKSTRYPVPAACMSASLSDLHHLSIAVYDRSSGQVFDPRGAIYASLATYREGRK